MKNIIIIPTLEPGPNLINLVNDLKKIGFKYIVVIDDGNVINNPTSGNSSGERKVSDIVYIGY